MQQLIRVSASKLNLKKENQLVLYIERLKINPYATLGMAGSLPVIYIYIYTVITFQYEVLHQITLTLSNSFERQRVNRITGFCEWDY
jgi:hypothetical protein